jgi:hypothetical protein
MQALRKWRKAKYKCRDFAKRRSLMQLCLLPRTKIVIIIKSDSEMEFLVILHLHLLCVGALSQLREKRLSENVQCVNVHDVFCLERSTAPVMLAQKGDS